MFLTNKKCMRTFYGFKSNMFGYFFGCHISPVAFCDNLHSNQNLTFAEYSLEYCSEESFISLGMIHGLQKLVVGGSDKIKRLEKYFENACLRYLYHLDFNNFGRAIIEFTDNVPSSRNMSLPAEICPFPGLA